TLLAEAAGGPRGLERGAARRDRPPRQHDRHRPAAGDPMNGVHDMGGMDGFGKVEPEPNEPTFHEPWEGRVMAMVRAMGANAGFNIDMQRFSRESIPPATYLSASYYQKWFLGLVRTLLDNRLAGADEIEAGRALRAGASLPRGKFA